MLSVTITGRIRGGSTAIVSMWLGKTERLFDREGPVGFAAAVQRVEYVRGESPVRFDRGQRETTWSFNYVWEFKTLSDAEIFLLDYKRTLPRVGTIDICTVGRSHRYIPNAELDAQFQPMGKAILATYRITGAEITSVQPSL